MVRGPKKHLKRLNGERPPLNRKLNLRQGLMKLEDRDFTADFGYYISALKHLAASMGSQSLDSAVGCSKF